MAGAVAEARAVDQPLRMLDPHADGQRLGIHPHAAPIQHRHGIPRAVPDREHDVIRLDPLAIGQVQGADVPPAFCISMDL